MTGVSRQKQSIKLKVGRAHFTKELKREFSQKYTTCREGAFILKVTPFACIVNLELQNAQVN